MEIYNNSEVTVPIAIYIIQFFGNRSIQLYVSILQEATAISPGPGTTIVIELSIRLIIFLRQTDDFKLNAAKLKGCKRPDTMLQHILLVMPKKQQTSITLLYLVGIWFWATISNNKMFL